MAGGAGPFTVAHRADTDAVPSVGGPEAQDVTRRPTATPGFDTPPRRHSAATALILVAVIVVASTIAVAFKESSLWAIERLGHGRAATDAASNESPLFVGTLVAGAVLAAAALGHHVTRRWPGRSGLDAIAATTRGEERRISFRATTIRSTGTWIMTAGLVSVGRESAILEAGGAVGSSLGRRFGGRGAAMATAGIAAAFATAYHAPIAAVVYLEEHLGVRRSRRAVTFTASGAVGGHLVATRLFDEGPLLPEVPRGVSGIGAAALVALLPALVGARGFLWLRETFDARRQTVTARSDLVIVVGISAIIAGTAVAVSPDVAGNGLDALRHASELATVGAELGVALLVVKLVATVAAIGSGAPGGVLTPTMTVGAGAALLTVAAVDATRWSAVDVSTVVAVAASVAVAVGLRSPLTAVFLLAEMTGDLVLAVYLAPVVLLATALDRRADRLLGRPPSHPATVHDEDA